MHKNTLFVGTLFFAMTALILILNSEAQSQSATVLKSRETEVRENMITITRQLGVTCTECHNTSNFRDDSKANFKIGKEHMKMTEVIREKGFDGKRGPEVSCFMCHRGHLKFDYKESIKK